MKKHTFAIAGAALISAVILVFTATLVQAEGVSPHIKNWEQAIGHWVNEEELKESPDGPWQQVSSEWDWRLMPGGFFAESPGRIKFPDGDISWIQVWGFDPVDQATFHHWFSSDGSHGTGTFEWSGTTLNENDRIILADGTELAERCAQKYSADFSSMTMTCERLTDGEWWIVRKVKGKKTN
jgi:hypothetical protein